jgi:hypothetical protein
MTHKTYQDSSSFQLKYYKWHKYKHTQKDSVCLGSQTVFHETHGSVTKDYGFIEKYSVLLFKQLNILIW